MCVPREPWNRFGEYMKGESVSLENPCLDFVPEKGGVRRLIWSGCGGCHRGGGHG